MGRTLRWRQAKHWGKLTVSIRHGYLVEAFGGDVWNMADYSKMVVLAMNLAWRNK